MANNSNFRAFGMNAEEMALRQVLADGERPISDRAFNLLLGGLLLYGFALTGLIMRLAGPTVYRMIAGSGTLVTVGMMILLLVCSFMGSAMMHSRSLPSAIAGYHLIVLPLGLVASSSVILFDPAIVYNALVITGGIVLLMMIACTARPDLFEGLGRSLLTALLCSIIAELAAIVFFGVAAFNFIDMGVAVIFALYIGYDWYRACTCAPTPCNAVAMAAELYLDILNLFLRVLAILARNSGKSRD